MGDVPAPFGEREAALPTRSAGAPEQPLARKAPLGRECPGQLLGRVITAFEPPLAVRRDERHEVNVRARQPLRDDARRLETEPPQASFLPAAHDPPDVGVVRDGSSRSRKGEPPARAFAAARDGPRGRSTATLTERWLERRQPCFTRLAEECPRRLADETAARQQ